MKTYKLIKKYPSVPNTMKEGFEVIFNKSMGLYTHDLTLDTFNISEVENNPEYWEFVLVPNYKILEMSFGKKIYKFYGERQKAFPSGKMVNVFRVQGENGIITDENLGEPHHNKETGNYKTRVHKIKRKSDDLEISVGDYVYDTEGEEDIRVEKIIVAKEFTGGMKLVYNEGIESIAINCVEKSNIPYQVSEEGTKIYVGDPYYFLWTSNPYEFHKKYHVYKIDTYIHGGDNSSKADNAKWFSNKQNAEKFIEDSVIFISEDNERMFLGDNFIAVNLNVDEQGDINDSFSIRSTDNIVYQRNKEGQNEARLNKVLWFKYLDNAEKFLEEIEPLYITEDGVALYSEIEYKNIHGVALQATGNDVIRKGYNVGIGEYSKPYKNRVWFADREKALDYLILHRKCLSLKDLEKIVESSNVDDIRDNIIKTIKNRI